MEGETNVYYDQKKEVNTELSTIYYPKVQKNTMPTHLTDPKFFDCSNLKYIFFIQNYVVFKVSYYSVVIKMIQVQTPSIGVQGNIIELPRFAQHC